MRVRACVRAPGRVHCAALATLRPCGMHRPQVRRAQPCSAQRMPPTAAGLAAAGADTRLNALLLSGFDCVVQGAHAIPVESIHRQVPPLGEQQLQRGRKQRRRGGGGRVGGAVQGAPLLHRNGAPGAGPVASRAGQAAQGAASRVSGSGSRSMSRAGRRGLEGPSEGADPMTDGLPRARRCEAVGAALRGGGQAARRAVGPPRNSLDCSAAAGPWQQPGSVHSCRSPAVTCTRQSCRYASAASTARCRGVRPSLSWAAQEAPA